MNSISKFSFREFLTILAPGLFFVYSITPIISLEFDNTYDTTNLNLILIFICSFLVGILFYVIDLPKNISFFKKATPTTQLENKIKEMDITLSKSKVHNTYFKFYDKIISQVQKEKTDRLTSMYHFSSNIFLSSILVLITYSIYWLLTSSFVNYFIIMAIISLISLICSLSLFYGKKKIKYYFDKQYESFIESDDYKNLIKSN